MKCFKFERFKLQWSDEKIESLNLLIAKNAPEEPLVHSVQLVCLLKSILHRTIIGIENSERLVNKNLVSVSLIQCISPFELSQENKLTNAKEISCIAYNEMRGTLQSYLMELLHYYEVV